MPTDISKPPDLFPLTIEWPDELYHRPEESVFVGREASKVPFFDVGIDLIDPEPSAPLRFKVFTDEFSASYEMNFSAKRVTYIPEQEDLLIRKGKKQVQLSEFFGLSPPII